MGYYKQQDLEDKLRSDIETDQMLTEEERAAVGGEEILMMIDFNHA